MSKTTMKKFTLIFAIFLILAAASFRVLRHFDLLALPPNVSPVAALALFAGAHLPRHWAFTIPLGAMVCADFIIGFYNPWVLASVYMAFITSGLLGLWVRRRKSVVRTVAASLSGSVFFFLLTNAAEWWFGILYPKTGAGLIASYTAGLPFFRWTLLGDLAFTGLLFGLAEVALWLATRYTQKRISYRTRD